MKAPETHAPQPMTEALVRLAAWPGSDNDPGAVAEYAAAVACDAFGLMDAVVMLCLDGDEPRVACHGRDVTDHATRSAMIGLSVDAITTGSAHTIVEDQVRREAVPLRHGASVIGALAVTCADPGSVVAAGPSEDAQRFADAVAFSVHREQRLRSATALATQLQHALTARVAIEQAKGLIAGSLDMTLDDAFECMRRFARPRRLRLGDVASDVLARRISVTALASPADVVSARAAGRRRP